MLPLPTPFRGGPFDGRPWDFAHDLRVAWRSLWRSPGLTLVALLTLSVGIGANTAIFSVVNSILEEPLPFKDPDRLAFVWSDMSRSGYPRGPLSGPELADLRERGTLFSGFGAVWATTTTLTGEGDPQLLRIGLVTPDFFPLLGVEAALGRTFEAGDESAAAPTAVVLSASLWQRAFASDPKIVGRQIRINDQPTTVVGVMSRGFKLLLPPDGGVPDDLEAYQLFNRNTTRGPRGQMFLRVVGRLRPGVPLKDAQKEVASIASQIGREFTDYGAAGRAFSLVGLHEDGVRDLRAPLQALFAGVAILLMVAVVNVAGLLVARAAARARETAIRMAIGAGKARLFRQCLAEGLVLSAFGGAAGTATAFAGLPLLLLWRPQNLARIDAANINLRVLAFNAAACMVVALLFSLAPFVEIFRSELMSVLRQGSQGGSRARSRARSALAVGQIALAVVLMVGAVLLVRTFRALQQVDPGFRSEERVSFRVGLPPSRYGSQDKFNAFSRQLQEALQALPGVTHVGAISHLPFDNVPNWSTNYLTERGAEESQARRADARAVTPGFFEAVDARLVEGRFFTESDDPASQPVVVVDETLARRAWPGGKAVGQTLAVDPRVTGHPTVWVTVVGVVGHVRHLNLMEDVREQVYFPSRQVPRNPVAYVLRSRVGPAGLAVPIKEALGRLDPLLPLYDVRPLTDALSGARATQRFTMGLALLFAAIAIGMAGLGVYAVTGYSAAKRRGEFGLRFALGATPLRVASLVVSEGLVLAGLGLILGSALALGATAYLKSQLFGVTPHDALSYLAVLPVLAAATLIACVAPALRAARVSPTEALRGE